MPNQSFTCFLKNIFVFFKSNESPSGIMTGNSRTTGSCTVVQNQIPNVCISLDKILAQCYWFLRTMDSPVIVISVRNFYYACWKIFIVNIAVYTLEFSITSASISIGFPIFSLFSWLASNLHNGIIFGWLFIKYADHFMPS